MKTGRIRSGLLLAGMLLGWVSATSAANTEGSATFNVGTTSYSAQYDPRNVAVVWVVDSSNKFVKTLCRHAATRITYLSRWATARGSYTNVDGTTSATLTTQPQTHTVVWNCRDTNNAVVPDGMYYFKVEYTSINGAGPYLTNGVGFLKSTTPVTTNFPNMGSLGGQFTGMSITYVPILADIEVRSIAPTAGNVNSTLAVVVGVSNRTASATPSFTVALSNVTAGALGIGTQTVASLAASAVTNLAFNWNTTGLSPGVYQLKAQASALASETNLANNVMTQAITLASAVHDVAVTGIGIGVVVSRSGATNVTVLIQNPGGFTETFGVSLTNLTASQGVGSRTVTNLAAGAVTNLVFSWNTSGLVAGIHTLQAVAGMVAGETQMANNTQAVMVIVANGLETNTLITKGSTWKYLDEGLDISGGPWTQDPANYYDGFWATGPAPLGYGTPGIATPIGVAKGAPPIGNPAAEAADQASNPPYDSVWEGGANGGTGFGAWQLSASGTGGFFIGSSTNNAGGASGGIDTGGRAWGLWASSGATEAMRPLLHGLATGQVLRVAFDNGWIASGRSAGISLRNAGGDSLWELYFYGGTNNYYLKDQGGIQYTAIPFTGDGMQIAFEPVSPTNYAAQVKTGAGTWNFSGGLMAFADTVVAQVRGWNWEAGPGSNADVFLNSLSVSNTVPTEPPDTSEKAITAYFRHEFTMDSAPIAASGLVRRVDGVVLYLNGLEIERQNMPPSGKPIASTLALAPVTGAATTSYFPFAIAPTNLQVGRNWLAAEVHLSAATNPALAFDLELQSLHETLARTYAVVPTALQPDGDVQAGDSVALAVTLANTGNAAIPAAVLIRDVATDAILATLPVPLLVAGESTTVHLTWPTLGLPTGDRTLQVATVVNGMTNWSATVSGTVHVAATDFAPRRVETAGSIGGFCGAVAAAGQIVYLGCGSTLEIWNVQPPFNPVRVGMIRLPGLIESIAVGGSTVHVAAGSSGVHLVNVSDSAAPIHVATFDTSGNAHRLALNGATLFVADGRGGARGLDVANPAAPVLTHAYASAGSARAVQSAGVNWLVLDADEGLQILTADATPVLAGEYRRITAGLGLATLASATFASDASAGLFRLDTANPAAPDIVTNVLLPAPGQALTVSDSALYVAAGTAGLLTVHPDTLAVVDTDAVGGEATDLALAGGMLYVAAGFGGCQALDVSNPLAPAPLGTFGSGVRAVDAAMSADTLFVAGGEAGFQVHSLTNLAIPRWLATVSSLASPRCVAVSASRAYVAEALGGVKIYGIANPAAPTLIGTIAPGELATVRRLVLSGTHLAMTDGRRIELLDISNPATPVPLANAAPPGYVFDLAASDSHIFAACGGGGLRILDRSTLALIGGYSTEPTAVVAVSINGETAYVGDGQATIRTLDISNPATPVLVHSSASPGFDLASAGPFVYRVDGSRQGAAVDVSAPLTPVSVLSLSNLTFALRVRAQGGIVLAAEDEAGLSIFNVRPGDINLNGIPDAFDRQMVDANPDDDVRTIWDVRPGDDFDGDGMTNLAEALAGTSPIDETSFFAVTAINPAPDAGGGEFVIRWFSEPGKTYTIHQSSDLTSGFTPLESGIAETAPINSYTAMISTATTFYMISVP